MNMLTIIEKLLAYFMESFFMFAVGLGCIGIKLKYSKILYMAGVFSLSIYGIRAFYLNNNIPLGTHAIILIVLLCLFLIFVGRQSLLNSIVATLISWSILTFGEGVFLIPFVQFIHLELFSMLNEPGATLLAVFLADIPLIIIFIVTYIFKITLIPLDLFSK